MNTLARIFAAAVTMATTLGVLAGSPSTAPGTDPWLRPAEVPAPPDNVPNPDRVHLGKVLFFEPRLSGSGFLSCASCHNPAMGWSDGLPTGFGHDFKRLGRATPTILNTVYQPLLMWDGRKPNLEEQALGPIEAVGEMNLPLDELPKRLGAINGYLALFEKAYPGEGITKQTVGKALASFERTIVSTTSPFDRWRKGDQRAVNESVKRGFELFQNKAACAKCHQGFNFTDNGFHNIGVRSLGDTEDEGRFAHRKIKVLKGAFKTPTLRDVELTAPYMHNGIYRTLEEVIDHYDRGGDTKTNLSPNMQALNLTTQEKQDLVAFMKSLTGDPMRVVLPQLPY
ncbi:cytochrome c peroxidase [Aquabacterium sp.]|uniref:cytochrome-c peroxidase n=1 Tax=Aquabacterium sp. TaxID=1872578 RepID=UPI0025B97636|nr:cytochrome c peroxidase [Aquabacterium sp.]